MVPSILAEAGLPYVIGLTFVVLVFYMLPLFGLIGTLGAMRHRDASWKALLGLAFMLAAYVGMATWSFFVTWDRRAGAAPSPMTVALTALGGILVLLFTVAGTVFAILGLVETYRDRQRYRRGRRRGWLAIVMASGFLVLVCASAVVALVRARSDQPVAVRSPAEGQPVTIADWNYRITPPAGWVSMEPKKLNPMATFAARRANAEIFTSVVCEHLDGRAVTLEAVAEVLKGRLQATGSATSTQRPEKMHDYEGQLIETEHRGPAGSAIFFSHWITIQAGNFYQVMTWGPLEAREMVRAESLPLRRSFQIVDPTRKVLPAAAQVGLQYHSPAHGWSIDVNGTPWKQRWAQLPTEVPAAEWGVLNAAGNACFCVIPVWVGQEEAPLEAVCHGLAAQVGIAFPDSAIYGVREAVSKGPGRLKGQNFRWDGERDGIDFVFRLRVLQSPECSYLLAAWAQKTRELDADMLDEVLDRVRFDPERPRRPTLDQLSRAEQAAHRLIMNGIGVSELSNQHLAEAQSWFKKAYEVGRSDPTILLNYVSTTSPLGKSQEGLDYLLGELKRFPGNKKLVTTAAELQMQAGDVPGGLTRYAELFDSGFRDDALFTSYVHAACEHQQAEAAAKQLERYALGHDSPRLRKLSALIAQARGDFPGALAMLDKLRAESPDDTDTLSALADCQFAAKQYTECVATCDRMLELHRDAAGVYFRKGLAEFSLKRYREAKEAIEVAHQKQPADPEVKRMLDYLTGLVGQGANLAVKTPIDPVPLPADFPPAPEAKADDAYVRGFSAYYRQAVQSISYQPGQEFRTTERRILTVVDQQGVQALSTMEYPYDPLAEEIYVNNITVRDAAGEITAVAKVEDSYVVDGGGDAQVASQQKILHVPVPSLQPGSTIESTITRRETGRVKNFLFRAHCFSKPFPILRSTVVLTAPESEVKWEASPGIAPVKWKGGLRWSVERPAVFRYEPQMVTLDKMLPMLWLSDTGGSWPSIAKEYLESIKDHLAIDPAVKAAAAEAVKGKTSEPEKIAALARLTQDKLTYKAVEFGRRARIPNQAAQTLANRYGDCKDHALLLTQLLESAGIPAKMALVTFGGPIRKGLPSLDQFDHMIVYTPQGKGGRFIDCTGKSSDLAAGGPPLGLATQTALILDPEHPQLATVPDYPPGCSDVKVERDITMPGSGADLLVKETVTYAGLIASSMRASLTSVQPSDRKRQLLRMLDAELPGIDLQEAEIEQIDDLHLPLRLRLRYQLKQRCQVAGARLIGRLPAPWEHMNLAPTPVEKRTTAFRLWIPTTLESTVRVTPPADWKPIVPEKRQLDQPFCTGGFEAKMEARVLRLDGHVTQKTGEFPAAQYGAYVDAMAEGVRMMEQSLVFEKR